MIDSLGTVTWVVFALLGVCIVLAVFEWEKYQTRTQHLALVLFATSFLLGLYEEIVSPVAAPAIGIMVLCAKLYSSPGKLRWVGLAGTVANAALVFTHKYPGFHNPIAIKEMLVTHDAIAYTRYLNFDKAAFAWSILQFGGIRKLPLHQLARGSIRLLPVLALAPPALLLLAYILGYARWDPKIGTYLWIWIPTNLLFTCVTEELVFREIFLSRPRKASAILGLAVASSILFGLAHFAGGWKYVLLATLAGGFYACAYLRTERLILFSVLTHFWVNLLHILFFTYPALATAFPP